MLPYRRFDEKNNQFMAFREYTRQFNIGNGNLIPPSVWLFSVFNTVTGIQPEKNFSVSQITVHPLSQYKQVP